MSEINEVAERVAARRAELDEEEKLLAERLDAVRTEREELAVAMRVWERMHAQLDAEKPSAQAGRHRWAGVECSWCRTGRRGRARPSYRRTTRGS
ncbi:hypothetical protein [Streptomyces puniciscabiei]|uniref:hypothetical protein n=1 Tax=Streptomyces puniciscabiei TaxID=164348 RepID=UPI00333478EC